MDLPFLVVPHHVDANVSVAHLIGHDLVILEDGHEVVNVFVPDIFYTEVVNNKCEGNGSCDVLP